MFCGCSDEILLSAHDTCLYTWSQVALSEDVKFPQMISAHMAYAPSLAKRIYALCAWIIYRSAYGICMFSMRHVLSYINRRSIQTKKKLDCKHTYCRGLQPEVTTLE